MNCSLGQTHVQKKKGKIKGKKWKNEKLKLEIFPLKFD